MARYIHIGARMVYRAVITVHTGSGDPPYMLCAGPYSTAGAAKAAIKRERRDWPADVVTGVVQRADTEWVEESA